MKMMKFFMLACSSLLSTFVLSIGAMAQTEAPPVLRAADLAPGRNRGGEVRNANLNNENHPHGGSYQRRS